jgi:uncharacterized membrane protein
MPMTLKLFDLLAILLSALVTGVFWGPWLGLTRSMAAFEPEVFLAITHRLTRNLGSAMTLLMPLALLSILPVLFLSFNKRPETFYLTLAGFGLFVVALLVTVLVEVPIVNRIRTWSVATLPADWRQFRDRWVRFHGVRIVAGIAGLALLVAGAIF